MELLKKAEVKLADMFKGAPKLSDSTKETLVKIWPWLALIGGILQVIAAWSAFRWARWGNEFVDSANDFLRSIGAEEVASTTRFSVWIWLSIAFLLVEAILLLLAFPKLQKRQKAGWDMLLLVALLQVVYAVISVFSDYRGGIGSLIINLIVSAVVLWLLFAVREKYKGSDFKLADVKHDVKSIGKKNDVEVK